MYEYQRMMLTVYLGTYRSAGPHVREFVDRAVAVSLRCAKTEEEKRLHNLLVLRFIVEQSLSVNRICKTLHMSRGNLPGAVKASIDRLMVLIFGVDGIDWG
jgi:hypothetical protein